MYGVCPLKLLQTAVSRAVCVSSVMSDICDPKANKALLPMRFSRQEYWSGLPFPPPRDLPDPGIEPVPLALQMVYLPWSHQEGPCCRYLVPKKRE